MQRGNCSRRSSCVLTCSNQGNPATQRSVNFPAIATSHQADEATAIQAKHADGSVGMALAGVLQFENPVHPDIDIPQLFPVFAVAALFRIAATASSGLSLPPGYTGLSRLRLTQTSRLRPSTTGGITCDAGHWIPAFAGMTDLSRQWNFFAGRTDLSREGRIVEFQMR